MRCLLQFFSALILPFVCMPSAHAMTCEDAPRPEVAVRLFEVPVKFDVSQSVEKLSAMDVDTKAVFPDHYHTRIGGVMSGRIAMDHRIGFNIRENGRTAEKCVRITHIKIDITMEPTIFIAQDYQKQSCWFKEIFAHESKHVDVDRAILSKYKEQLTDAMNMLLLEPQDYVTTVSAYERAEPSRMEMERGLINAMEVMFNKMMRDRKEQQQNVDNVHEYTEISRACRTAS